MITYVSNKTIDRQKYDACIADAIQSKVYAFSWYLDAVTETWNVLVLKDYKAVMPLPTRKKYGIIYIFQPYWVQHLGVFSKSPLSEDYLKLFLDNIPKNIKFINYNINFKANNIIFKTNYILPLQDDYKSLYSCFSKLRKRSITKGKKANLVLKITDNWSPILNLSKQKSAQDFKMTKEAFLKFEKLLNKAKQLNMLKILAAYSKENKLVGGAFFIISKKRITYLFSVVSEQGRNLQAMSIILNAVIKDYADSDYILDFEGSMLPGVAAFFKSFKPQNEIYYHLKKWRLF